MSIRAGQIQHYRKRAKQLRSQAARDTGARDVLLSIAESYEQLAGGVEANTVAQTPVDPDTPFAL